MRRFPPYLAALVMLTGSAAAASVGTANAAGSLTGLIATYSSAQSWSSGFEGDYSITNDSNATVNSWTLTFELPRTRRSPAPGTAR
jgi:hypothetical protein